MALSPPALTEVWSQSLFVPHTGLPSASSELNSVHGSCTNSQRNRNCVLGTRTLTPAHVTLMRADCVLLHCFRGFAVNVMLQSLWRLHKSVNWPFRSTRLCRHVHSVRFSAGTHCPCHLAQNHVFHCTDPSHHPGRVWGDTCVYAYLPVYPAWVDRKYQFCLLRVDQVDEVTSLEL